MQTAELTSTITPALETVSTYTLEKGTDALDAFTLESLDLFSALIPSVAIWAREALPSESLADRVRAFGSNSVDVYIAPVREPMISGNPFSERKTLICPEGIDDLSLKRTLFGAERHEEMMQRVMHISALLFAGCIATFGSAPLLAVCAYAPLHCIASAYSQDTAFLEAYPEEKEALIVKREQEIEPPVADPATLDDYCANAYFYAGLYLSAVVRRDVVLNFEVFTEPELAPEPTPEPEIEVEPEPEVEVEVEVEPPVEEVIEEVKEPQQKPAQPVSEPDAKPVKDPRKRGGHQGR